MTVKTTIVLSFLRDEVAQALPVASAANSTFIQARSEGLGDLDISAVIEVLLAQKKK